MSEGALDRRDLVLLIFLLWLFRQRLLNGLAGEHLVAHGGVVYEAGYDHADLLEIIGLQAVVDIHVGVVGAGFVLDGILNELESGDTDGVE